MEDIEGEKKAVAAYVAATSGMQVGLAACCVHQRGKRERRVEGEQLRPQGKAVLLGRVGLGWATSGMQVGLAACHVHCRGGPGKQRRPRGTHVLLGRCGRACKLAWLLLAWNPVGLGASLGHASGVILP